MRKNKEDYYTCLSCFGVSSFILFLVIIINYLIYADYKLSKCNVTYINYPLFSPHINNSYWDYCRCRKKCKTYTPVVNIYVNIVNNNYRYLLKNDFNDKYTFFNKTCLNDDKKDNIKIFLNNSRTIYNTYINKTIDCYFNGYYVLIDIINIFERPYTLVGFILVFLIGSITCFYGIENYKEIKVPENTHQFSS